MMQKLSITLALAFTLTSAAWAEQGLVQQVKRDSSGHTTIIIKDYRQKKPRPLKATPRPSFREYDLGPSSVDYTSPSVQTQAPAPAAVSTQPVQPVQTYSQRYAPGPNRSMAAGGGGSSFSSTVLPTSPYYYYPYNPYPFPYYNAGGYGPYIYPNRPVVSPGYYVTYPSTFPAFPYGQSGVPPAIVNPTPGFFTPPVRPVIRPAPTLIIR